MTVVLIICFSIIIIFVIYILYFKSNLNKTLEDIKKLINIGYLDDALNELENLLKKHRDNITVHWLLAEVYFRKKMYEKAELECQKILALKKFEPGVNEIEIRKRLVDIYYMQKKFDKAIKELLILTHIMPDPSEVYLELGKLHIEKESYREAIVYFEKYNKTKFSNPYVYYYLGVCYFHLKAYDMAETNLLKSIQMNINTNEPHYYLGLIYSITGNFDKALEEFNFPQTRNEFKYGILKEKGKIFYTRRDFQKVIENILEALKIIPENKKSDEPELRYILADCYIRTGMVDKAIEEWKTILKIAPNYKDVNDKLTLYLQREKNENYNRFISASPDEFVKMATKIVELLNFSIAEHQLRKDGVLDILAFEKTTRGAEHYLIEFIRSDLPIGEFVLREMHSKMKDMQVYKGICVSTTTFTEGAKEFSKTHAIELIDKTELIKLLSKLKIKKESEDEKK